MSRKKRKPAMTPADWAAFQRRVAFLQRARLIPEAGQLKESLDRLVDLAIHTGRAKHSDLESAAKLALYLIGAEEVPQ